MAELRPMVRWLWARTKSSSRNREQRAGTGQESSQSVRFRQSGPIFLHLPQLFDTPRHASVDSSSSLPPWWLSAQRDQCGGLVETDTMRMCHASTCDVLHTGGAVWVILRVRFSTNDLHVLAKGRERTAPARLARSFHVVQHIGREMRPLHHQLLQRCRPGLFILCSTLLERGDLGGRWSRLNPDAPGLSLTVSSGIYERYVA